MQLHMVGKTNHGLLGRCCAGSDMGQGSDTRRASSETTPDPSLFPEVEACDDILSVFVFVGVKDLVGVSSAIHKSSVVAITYLSCRRMKHPNVLARQYVDQSTSLNVPDLDEAWLECENVRIRQCKRLRLPFPRNLPIRTCTPAVSIDEE